MLVTTLAARTKTRRGWGTQIPVTVKTHLRKAGPPPEQSPADAQGQYGAHHQNDHPGHADERCWLRVPMASQTKTPVAANIITASHQRRTGGC